MQIEMRSAERNQSRGFFLEHCPIQAGTHSEGGCSKNYLRDIPQRLAPISLIPLWLSTMNRPAPLPTREKGGDESDPMGPDRSVEHRAAIQGHMTPRFLGGGALVLIYPCGKAENTETDL